MSAGYVRRRNPTVEKERRASVDKRYSDRTLGVRLKEEPAPQEGFGRERERVLAETLWSRLMASIGEPPIDL